MPAALQLGVRERVSVFACVRARTRHFIRVCVCVQTRVRVYHHNICLGAHAEDVFNFIHSYSSRAHARIYY